MTALAFLALLLLGRLPEFEWVKGSTTATTLFSRVPLVDPLAALEAALASRSWASDVLLGAGLLAVAAAFLGPVFCGWVCPLGLALDLNGALRARLASWLPKGRRRRPGLRRLLLAAVLGFALVGGLPAFQAFSPINLIARSVVFDLDPWLALLGGLLLVELVLPRLWCRSVCPLGALYSILGRPSLLRVRADVATPCRPSCGACTARCPLGITVMSGIQSLGKESVDDPACTRCGACIDSCPRSRLRLGLGARLHRDPASRP